MSVSEHQHVHQPRSIGKDSNSCHQATTVESFAHAQQSLVTAAADTGRLQSRRSRGGRIRGRRSLDQGRTHVHHKDVGNKKLTGIDQGEGSPVVTVKRARGRPRKVCITLMR